MCGLERWFCQITVRSWIQRATSLLFKKFTFLVNTEWEPIKRSLNTVILFHEAETVSHSSPVSRIFPLFFSFSRWLLLGPFYWFAARAGGRAACQSPARLACSWRQFSTSPTASTFFLMAVLTNGKSVLHLIISTTWVNLQINWCVGGKASAIVKTFVTVKLKIKLSVTIVN